jgi:predicted nucleic acid-binding protein
LRETIVVDASVAVKWVVEEEGTTRAVALRSSFVFTAPELILAECANILWKKAQRGELTRPQAVLAARLLEQSGVDFVTLQGLSETATQLALELSHPAYDCVYLALASRRGLRFVTADRRLIVTVRERADAGLKALCADLSEFATSQEGEA